jgi:hypothetical protein
MTILCKALGFVLIFAAMSGVARAFNPFATPEIDAGTAGSALTMLAGGMLILKDRSRAK